MVTVFTVRHRRQRLVRRHGLGGVAPGSGSAEDGLDAVRVAAGSGLAGAGQDSVRDLARSLVGLHATDPVSVYLQVHARLPDATTAEVEAEMLWVSAESRLPAISKEVRVRVLASKKAVVMIFPSRTR